METNDDTISLEDAACGYKGLMVIERCFRSLKRTQIKVMPMYHWASRRIEAHVKICVLALLIERVAELACGRPGQQIQGALDELQITEFFNLNFRALMRNELPAKNINLLKLLKINPPKQVIELEKLTGKRPDFVDTRGISFIRADARASGLRAILCFYKNQTQVNTSRWNNPRIPIHSKSFKRFKRRVGELTGRGCGLSIGQAIARLNQFIKGWCNCYRHACVGLPDFAPSTTGSDVDCALFSVNRGRTRVRVSKK